MLVVTEDIFMDMIKLDKFLWEVVSLPDSLQKRVHTTSTRKKMLEKYGEKAFLDPDNLKFPIVNPNTGKIDCRLLYAARTRALQFAGRKTGYRELAAKAKSLYQQYGCSRKLHVEIHESNERIDLNELLELKLIFCNGDTYED